MVPLTIAAKGSRVYVHNIMSMFIIVSAKHD